MITGLPPLVAPIEQSIRCACGLRYVVFIGGSNFDQAACEAARDWALQMNAEFVDVRIVPFMRCRCGALLDFTAMDLCVMVM
jgi:hypothetical protein